MVFNPRKMLVPIKLEVGSKIVFTLISEIPLGDQGALAPPRECIVIGWPCLP
jgi:hypothetical protein